MNEAERAKLEAERGKVLYEYRRALSERNYFVAKLHMTLIEQIDKQLDALSQQEQK